MSLITLYLVRHEESEQNLINNLLRKSNIDLPFKDRERLANSDAQIQLTDLGVTRAQNTAQVLINENLNLENLEILCSPFIRSKHTLAIILSTLLSEKSSSLTAQNL